MNINHHNTIDGNKIKLSIYYTYTSRNVAGFCSLISWRIHSQTKNPHRLLPAGCLSDFTRIESNQIIIKHDIMVLKLESNMCAEVGSNTYIKFSKLELLFPFTKNYLDEFFPSPAWQRK